ncbi:hypothetical protein L579_3133 [Pantoea sp. AS-PWVM4]|nr:hypothetical protein L579_3133 [Pantoea sp. AS-PWVM4]
MLKGYLPYAEDTAFVDALWQRVMLVFPLNIRRLGLSFRVS